jgi:hypothetical protein
MHEACECAPLGRGAAGELRRGGVTDVDVRKARRASAMSIATGAMSSTSRLWSLA